MLEQRARYAALSKATGLVWTLQVSSGGKSIHSYLAFSRPLAATDPLRDEIQRLLVVTLEGDTQITNADRVMRTPAAVGHHCGQYRKQPVLALRDSRYDPEHIAKALRAYGRSLGIADTELAFEDLKTAESLTQGQRKGWADVEGADLVAHELRVQRGRPDASDLRQKAERLLGRRVFERGSRRRDATGEQSAYDRILRVPTSEMTEYRSIPKGTYVKPPCCRHKDSTKGVVNHEAGDEPRLFCFRCGHTVMAERPTGSVHPKLTGVTWLEEVVTPPPPPKRLPYIDTPGGVTSERRWQHPPIPQEGGVYLLTAPCGTGKTQQAVEAANALNAAGELPSVLVVTPTRRLTEAATRRFAVGHYKDLVGELTQDRLAVCLPSLLRVPFTDGDSYRGYDLVVLDEVEGLLTMLHSPQVMCERGPHGSFATSGPTLTLLQSILTETLRRGGRVVASDAYMHKRSVTVLRSLVPKHAGEFRLLTPPKDYEPLRGRKEGMFPSKGEAVSSLLRSARLGARGTVACDSKTMVVALAKVLRGLVREDGSSPKVLEIHGNSKDNGWAEDVDESWGAVDWVVYNQAAGEGVSYTGGTLPESWLLASVWGDGAVTWNKLRQLASRNRTAERRFSWVSKRGRRTFRSRDVIRREHMAAASVSGQLAFGGYDDEGRATPAPKDRLHFETKVLDSWATEMRSSDVRGHYYRDLATQGCEVVDASPVCPTAAKIARAALKAATKEAIGEKVLSATSAELLDDDEARELRKLEPQQRSDQQESELVRHGVLNFWGRTAEELVKDWVKGGKHRRAATKFVFASIVRQAGPALEALRAKERTWVAEMGGYYRAHLRHREQRAEVVDAIMRLAGLDPELIDPSLAPHPIPLVNGCIGYDWRTGESVVLDCPPPLPDPPPQVWSKQSLAERGFKAGVRKLGKEHPLRELLGSVAKDAARDPVRFLNGVLRLRGLKPRRRPRDKGYWLNPSDMTAWAEDCRRQFAWLASRGASGDWRPCAARDLEPMLFVDPTVYDLLGEGHEPSLLDAPNRVTVLPPIAVAVEPSDQEVLARLLHEVLGEIDNRVAHSPPPRMAAPL